MGQPVTVIEKPTSKPDVVRFETNRTLTGMGHEIYRSADDAVGDAPCDELARRLFAHGGVASVHVFANIITVHLVPGGSSAGLAGIVEDLYIFYADGVTPAPPV